MYFLTYVTWDNVLNWKKNEIDFGRIEKQNHRKPYAFGTSKRYIYNEYLECTKNNNSFDGILWIFSIPKFRNYYSRPSLIAKIKIDVIVDRAKAEDEQKYGERIPRYIKNRWIKGDKKLNWRYVVLGARNSSQYFPINFAYNELKAAVKEKSKAKVPQKFDNKINSYFSNYFRTIRKIDEEANLKLNNFHPEKKNIVFLSYRRGSGNNIVLKTIDHLIREDVVCWLDVSRIPQIDKNDIKFLDFFYYELFESIEKSTIFLALKREDYFESPWTSLEYCFAKHEERRRNTLANKALPLKLFEIDLSDLSNESNVKKLVQEIKQWIDINTA